MVAWLLLHGTPLDPAVWDAVRRELGDPPVCAPDLRLVAAGEDQAALAARAHEALDAARLGSAPVHVVGHSFGGQVALEFALAFPERVASLGIVCSRDTPFPALPMRRRPFALGRRRTWTRRSRGGSLLPSSPPAA